MTSGGGGGGNTALDDDDDDDDGMFMPKEAMEAYKRLLNDLRQMQKEETQEALNFALLLVEEYIAEDEDNVIMIMHKLKDVGKNSNWLF